MTDPTAPKPGDEAPPGTADTAEHVRPACHGTGIIGGA